MDHAPDIVKLVAQAMRDARLRLGYSEAVLNTLLAHPVSLEDTENAKAALTALAQTGLLVSAESDARVERAEAALDRIADWHGCCAGRQIGEALSQETIASIEEWLKNITTPDHPGNLSAKGSDVRANALGEAATYVGSEAEKLRADAAGYNGSHAAYMLDEDADLLAGIEAGILALVVQPTAALAPPMGAIEKAARAAAVSPQMKMLVEVVKRKAATSEPVSVPDGWQLVPKLLTTEILWAADKAYPTREQDDPDHSDFILFALTRAEWAAMLDAAPAPPLSNEPK